MYELQKILEEEERQKVEAELDRLYNERELEHELNYIRRENMGDCAYYGDDEDLSDCTGIENYEA